MFNQFIKAKLFFLLICFHAFAEIEAETEYDIVLLAPEGHELTSSVGYEFNPTINASGYVGGTFYMNEEDSSTPFVYHPKQGLRVIPLPEDKKFGKILSINNHGLAVGTYREKSKDDRYWYYEENDNEDIFLYNMNKNTRIDLTERFNSVFLPLLPQGRKVENLWITDNNDVIVTFTKNTYDETFSVSFILDLTKDTVSVLTLANPKYVSLAGHIVGCEKSMEYKRPKTSWFMNPHVGHQELGSLDIFNRWAVHPDALSPQGVVVGTGADSHGEEKLFFWTLDDGLQQIDISKEYIFITAVNDKKFIVGQFENDDEDEDWYTVGFLFHPEQGILELEKDSSPKAINNHSQIVGSLDDDLKSHTFAFIWDSEHGSRDLTNLIPKDTGWKYLLEAHDINDTGLILGRGLYYGVEQFFLLIPRNSIED